MIEFKEPSVNIVNTYRYGNVVVIQTDWNTSNYGNEEICLLLNSKPSPNNEFLVSKGWEDGREEE